MKSRASRAVVATTARAGEVLRPRREREIRRAREAGSPEATRQAARTQTTANTHRAAPATAIARYITAATTGH